MKVSERRERLALAERFATDPVKDYLTEKGADLEILVDQDPGLNRLEFCEMLTGDDWILEEKWKRAEVETRLRELSTKVLA